MQCSVYCFGLFKHLLLLFLACSGTVQVSSQHRLLFLPHSTCSGTNTSPLNGLRHCNHVLFHTLLLLPALGIKWKVRHTITACISIPPSTLNFLGVLSSRLRYLNAPLHTPPANSQDPRRDNSTRTPDLHSGGIFSRLQYLPLSTSPESPAELALPCSG